MSNRKYTIFIQFDIEFTRPSTGTTQYNIYTNVSAFYIYDNKITEYFSTINTLNPSIDKTYIKAEYDNFLLELKQLNAISLSIALNNYYYIFYCSKNVSVPISSGIVLTTEQINNGLSILQNIHKIIIERFFDTTIQNIYQVATSATTFYKTSSDESTYMYYQVLFYPSPTIIISDNAYFTSIKNYIDIIILYLNNSSAVFNYSLTTSTKIGNPSST